MKTLQIFSITLFLLFTGCLNSTDPSYDDTEDLAYLEEYAQKEGVTQTNNGLMYRVIEEGDENAGKPSADQYAIIQYEGKPVNGSNTVQPQYDFEIIKPNEFNAFPGLAEGLQLMNEGATYEFVLPSELAVDDGRVFIFEVELESYLRKDQNQFLADNAELEDINVTSSGLQYRIVEEGDGEKPTLNSQVEIKYKGTYTSGYVFDQTSGNDTAEINMAELITGFSEGLQLMKEGAKFELFISPELGYGNGFPQYGSAVLIFEVELVNVNSPEVS